MKRLPALILLIIFSLTACGGPSFRGTVLDEPVDVADFALTDENGGVFRLSDQQGNVVLLFFGYTSCPDVCPTTLATWRKIHEALGEDAERVRFVFVTVDPERDTAERLGMHVNAFNPDFIGLTGTPEELDP
ncbi:MAG TPA: SCO family protein, partial [Anaerolineae bacterium]|nr:SCO family protein [Anaerolineae bacterium]